MQDSCTYWNLYSAYYAVDLPAVSHLFIFRESRSFSLTRVKEDNEMETVKRFYSDSKQVINYD